MNFWRRVSTPGRWSGISASSAPAFVSIDGLYRAMGPPGAIRSARGSATPALPATIRFALADADEGKVSVQLSLLTEPA